MDVSTFDGLAVGVALAVLIVVAATLTLLPALLGFAARPDVQAVAERELEPFPGAAEPLRRGQPPVEAWWGGARWGWPRWE